VYYGAEKPFYAITLLSEFIQIDSIVTNPMKEYAVYQLYPFTYYFVLPEPVPPPDIVNAGKNTLAELSLFFPSVRHQRQKLEPTSTYLSLILTLYYLLNRDEWATINETIAGALLTNIVEYLQTVPQENFLYSICLAMAVKYERLTSIPPAHLTEIQWIRYCYYQTLHTLEVLKEYQ